MFLRRWWGRRYRLEDYVHWIGHVLIACPCSSIDSNSDEPPENYIASGCGHPAPDNFARNRNLLRNVTRLLKCSVKFLVLFDYERTRCDASHSVTGVNLSAARRRVEPNAGRGPANYSGACTAQTDPHRRFVEPDAGFDQRPDPPCRQLATRSAYRSPGIGNCRPDRTPWRRTDLARLAIYRLARSGRLRAAPSPEFGLRVSRPTRRASAASSCVKAAMYCAACSAFPRSLAGPLPSLIPPRAMAQSGWRARKYLQKQCLASIWFVYRYVMMSKCTSYTCTTCRLGRPDYSLMRGYFRDAFPPVTI
jgi:hypothetical protein